MEKVMKLLDVNGEPTPFLHIHLIIFLQLDPKSLKSARLVSREWCKFVKSQIWINKKMRKRLEQRLVEQWRRKQPSRREFVLRDDMVVERMSCSTLGCFMFIQFLAKNGDKTETIMHEQ